MDVRLVTDLVVGMNGVRHLWPRIAHDLVQMHLFQGPSSVVMSYQDICQNYGLSMDELRVLSEMEDFQELVRREADRAKQMGHRAGFLLRAEAIATELVETLYKKLTDKNNDVEVKDIIKSAELLIKASGLGVEREAVTASANVALQINVPTLANPKLEHIMS